MDPHLDPHHSEAIHRDGAGSWPGTVAWPSRLWNSVGANQPTDHEFAEKVLRTTSIAEENEAWIRTAVLCQLRWDALHTANVATTSDATGMEGEVSFEWARDALGRRPAPAIFDLRRLGPDHAAQLAAQGVSLEHLRRNFRATLGGWREDALAFQLEAVRTGSMHAVCPVTGQKLASRTAFLANVNTIFYRFTAVSAFYLVVSGIGRGFQKVAIYFPLEEVAVIASDDWSFDFEDVLELKARMVADFDLCRSYLAKAESTRSLSLCLGFYHFAHHLWNELPGVERVRKSGSLSKVSRFLVLREPLGPLNAIFPEIPNNKIWRLSGAEALFRAALSGNLFVLRVGSRFLPAAVVRRVYRVARQAVSEAERERAASAHKGSSPLLWIGVRVGDRSWTDQAQKLADLIERLQKVHPRLGLVFDGFSHPADRSQDLDPDLTRLVAQEAEVVSEVVSELRHRGLKTPVENLIGCSIHVANLWAHAIHLYVSPYGSLQHKVGWLAHRPGVIHSNRTLLQNPADYVWTSVQGALPPRYVAREAVWDVEGFLDQPRYNETLDASESGAGVLAINNRMKLRPAFANYRVDPEAIRVELEALLDMPAWRTSLPARVAQGCRRRFKAGLAAGLRRLRGPPL